MKCRVPSPDKPVVKHVQVYYSTFSDSLRHIARMLQIKTKGFKKWVEVDLQNFQEIATVA